MSGLCGVKLTFHYTNIDTDTDILADTSDRHDFVKLFLWQAERHADILATILAVMSARMSVSASWNASLTVQRSLAIQKFEYRPVHCQVTALGKLLTHICLCHQAV